MGLRTAGEAAGGWQNFQDFSAALAALAARHGCLLPRRRTTETVVSPAAVGLRVEACYRWIIVDSTATQVRARLARSILGMIALHDFDVLLCLFILLCCAWLAL